MELTRRALLAAVAAAPLTAQTRRARRFIFPLGVTRSGRPIQSLVDPQTLDITQKLPHVLLVGGLEGPGSAERAVTDALRWFDTGNAARRWRRAIHLSAVPLANPDPTPGPFPFPPPGEAYTSPAAVEAQYLWRWLGMTAPDLVIHVRVERGWRVPRNGAAEAAGLRIAQRKYGVTGAPTPGSLAAALDAGSPAEVGPIPAIEAGADGPDWFGELLGALFETPFRYPSPARRELQNRLARPALTTAEQLARRYGHELPSVVYIPAVALMGRLHLGDLTGSAEELEDVERIVAPYVAGAAEALPEKPSPSHFSGHLIFGELALRTRKPEYLHLVRAAASYAFQPDGAPREAMPFHNDMSDGVFMGSPILALAGKLTGEAKYFEAALRNAQFFVRIDRRPDGLYRHSPLDEAAWGRGNGFPALGLALTLEWMDPAFRGYEEIRQSFRGHIAALAPYQDATGAWHQIIDHPESYRELTATAMILFAMIRGVRRNWLDRVTYERPIERAWQAINTRIRADGHLVDVCTGTGKQNSLRDYLDRIAILGPDPRGGAMTLLAATEMARWRQRG